MAASHLLAKTQTALQGAEFYCDENSSDLIRSIVFILNLKRFNNGANSCKFDFSLTPDVPEVTRDVMETYLLSVQERCSTFIHKNCQSFRTAAFG